jgi:hypothetical protein
MPNDNDNASPASRDPRDDDSVRKSNGGPWPRVGKKKSKKEKRKRKKKNSRPMTFRVQLAGCLRRRLAVARAGSLVSRSAVVVITS